MGSAARLSPKKRIKNFNKNLFIICGIVPVLIWAAIFAFFPIITGMTRAFTDWTLASPNINFIGLDNFVRMTTDRVFLVALRNTVLAVLVTVPLTVVLALLLALAFNSLANRLQRFFTMIFFVPSVVSMVAISAVWIWLYHPSFGLINYFLGMVGISPQPFLRDPNQALNSVLVIMIWQGMGFYAVILLAGLKSLPSVFYEAATIDGARALQKFIHITLPQLLPTILFVCIMAVIGTFQVFVPIDVMTGGGPGDSSTVLALYIFRVAIGRLDMGYGSAIAMVLFVIIMIITIIQWKFVRSDWEY